jgi:hypothetical protein
VWVQFRFFFCLMVRFFVATRRHARGHVDGGNSAPDVPHENIFRPEAFIQRIPQRSFLKRIFMRGAGSGKLRTR